MSEKEELKHETILEVNEITSETVEAEEKERTEKEKTEKERESNLRKEKLKKAFNKILKDYDINYIAKLLMWVYFFISAITVNTMILNKTFKEPALRVFIAEDSLKEKLQHNIENIENLSIVLESFDLNIRESNSDEMIIRYSKKYDKKINIQKGKDTVKVEEKNKFFKFIRFDSSNNLMVIEIPSKYKGSLEIESKNGTVKIEKYKILEKSINEDEEVKEKFYNNFFNI